MTKIKLQFSDSLFSDADVPLGWFWLREGLKDGKIEFDVTDGIQHALDVWTPWLFKNYGKWKCTIDHRGPK